MEGQSVEELLAKAKQEEAERLQRITVHKELELEFDLGNLLASDRNPPTVLRQAGPSPEAELRALARDKRSFSLTSCGSCRPCAWRRRW